MAPLKITIEGAEQGPSWVAVEQMVRTCFTADSGTIPNKRLQLIQITRTDERADYRGLGKYLLVFRDWVSGKNLHAVLEVL